MHQLEPLKIRCTDSRCDADLHCFRPRPKMSDEERGRCRDCGADLIDWERMHRRDIAQVHALFEALPHELIRHHYWHVPIPERVRELALKPRREVLRERTERAVRNAIALPSSQLFRDGTQTYDEHSKHARIYHYGQHATATCCRKCLEYWHGIPREQPLSEQELVYFTELVWLYIEQRVALEAPPS
jgi:hypothetical protein